MERQLETASWGWQASARIGRWIMKSQAVCELGISLSTLDRQIKAVEKEAVRQDRRVYVLVRWPKAPSDEVLLYRACDRIDDLKSDVFRLKNAALKLETEQDEALDDKIASKNQSLAMQDANLELSAVCERIKRLLIGLGGNCLVLLTLLVVLVLRRGDLLTRGSVGLLPPAVAHSPCRPSSHALRLVAFPVGTPPFR